MQICFFLFKDGWIYAQVLTTATSKELGGPTELGVR